MAITADVVEVRLEADTAGYIRDLRTAETQGTRSLDRVSKAALDSGGAYRQLASSATASSQQVVDANQRIASSAAGANLQVGNIAAQFQDIGVTAASGMNPLIIALQQGTQLSAILNQSVGAGVSPVRALGAAFAQILNPISLGTVAIIALGTAAVQYFSSLIGQGQVSEETLKTQADLIRDVADNWGDAVPALRAYVDQLDRAKATGDLGAATDIAIEQQYQSLIRVVGDLRAEFAAARIDIQQLGGDAQEIDLLQAAFDELERKARDSTATAADLERVVALIGQTSGATSPGIASLSGVLGGLAGAFAQAAQAAQTFRDQRDAALAPTAQVDAFNSNREFIAEQERLNGLTADQLALENEINRVKASAERSEVPLSDAQALTVATENLAAAERRRAEARALTGSGGGGGRTSTVSEADREAQAVLALIEQLQHEYDIIGLTNEQRAVANALRQAGAAATEAQRAEIEALVTATLTEREALAQLEETTQMWAQTAQDATRGFINDLIEGKSAAEALGNVLKNIGSQLINIGLSSLFGGFNFGGPRANGGPVSGGSTYLVGERGPELFTPSSAGRITSNADLQGGGGVTIQMSNDFRGVDAASVARIEAGLERLAANIVPTVRREIAVGPKKGRR